MLSEVKFRESDHSYTNREGKRYTSVTTLLGMYKNKYNEDFWTLYKAIQYKLGISEEEKKKMSKLYTSYGGNWNNTPYEPLYIIAARNSIDVDSLIGDKKEIADTWRKNSKESCERGTRFHQKMENEVYETGKGDIKGEEAQTVFSYSLDLTKLQDGFHAEVLLYNHFYEVAGQMDKLIISSVFNDRYAKADDWKTNKQISTINPVGNMMKYPLHHLQDCNYIHYAIQINTYLWLLAQFGFTPMFPSQFTHVLLNKEEKEIGRKTYILPNLQIEVKNMLDHFKANKK